MERALHSVQKSLLLQSPYSHGFDPWNSGKPSFGVGAILSSLDVNVGEGAVPIGSKPRPHPPSHGKHRLRDLVHYCE